MIQGIKKQHKTLSTNEPLLEKQSRTYNEEEQTKIIAEYFKSQFHKNSEPLSKNLNSWVHCSLLNQLWMLLIDWKILSPGVDEIMIDHAP